MNRTTCRGCSGRELELFLDLGTMALAGGFLAGPQAIADEKTYRLPVHVCRGCGLVQILDAIDPDILFQDYSFSSTTIAPLVDHFTKYAQWLKERFDPALVVEFGCNDGVPLAPLQAHGIRACGVDVSQNIGDMARAKGLDVITGFFSPAVAADIAATRGQADIVTGSNAFAHNDRPDVILEAARAVLKPTGRLCLEVMYVDDLLETLQWDTLYHEHLTFYSLSTLEVLVNRYGFYIEDAVRMPMHGGSLRVVASRSADVKPSPGAQAIRAKEHELKMSDLETWQRFGRVSQRKIAIVRDTFGRIAKHARVAAYGAAGKATMWVNACGMDYLQCVVDASPLRAGKLMPGTHTPIVFPQDLKADPPDYVFVTAWNYADGIRAKESWFQGIWSVPLPDLRFF